MEMNESVRNRKDTRPKSYKFGLHVGKKLCKILGILFKVHLCIILFSLICLVSLLEQYIIYHIGIVPSGFYQALSDKDWKGFVEHSIVSVVLILAIAFVLSSKKYIINVLYVLVRKILTSHIHVSYFDFNNYYYINTLGYSLTDNPDQRITQDIDKFSKELSSMVSPLTIAPFTIGYYSYQCFSTTGWVGPVAVLGVFVLSAAINKLLIKPIMNLVILQEKYEGFFRFKHMHIRSNAESIAMQGAGKAELMRSEAHFTNLVSIQQTLFLKQYPLDMSVSLFDYIGSIVSYLILAAPIFSGNFSDLSPGEIASLVSQNAFITIYLISCFSSLIDLSTSFSNIAGLTYRISELLNLVEENSQRDNLEDDNLEDGEFKELNPVVIEINNVTFGSPSKELPLVIGLNLTIALGTNLLITGHSSSGKTSFIRIIRGLWPIWRGNIKRKIQFTPSNVFFLSQKALLSDGSLLHQIIYPLGHPNFEIDPRDEELINTYVNYVGLDHVLLKAGGLNSPVDWNWNDILTPGEAQRLSFVRLFYHKPKLAFLDEATSAVAIEMEEKLYKKCKALKITVVTAGHRTSLQKYHDVQLHFDGTGNWVTSFIDE